MLVASLRLSVIMSDDVAHKTPYTPWRSILEESEKRNPLLDSAPHVHTHLAAGVPLSRRQSASEKVLRRRDRDGPLQSVQSGTFQKWLTETGENIGFLLLF